MNVGPGILFVLFIVFAALMAFYAHRQQAQRREALARLAASLGWSFSASKDYSFGDRYAQFGLFSTGSSRYAYNLMSGRLGPGDHAIDAVMGDFHYTTRSGSGKSRSTKTHQFSFVILTLPFLRTPELQIRTENFLDKFSGILGFDDIDFESAEFSRRFHVKSSDKRFAYDVVHPQMMEFLMAVPPPAVHLHQAKCCLSDGSRLWSPEQFGQRLDWARRFFALWPRHVLEQLDAWAP
jgi:hypothetical protein